jgi:NAD-dependent dihydropyrimidine dehydrogenase PreA subunit
MSKKAIICNCQGGAIDVSTIKEIHAQLIEFNTDVIKLTDLCGLAATSKEAVKDILNEAHQYMVAACHPRATRLILEKAGIEGFGNIRFLNMRDNSPEAARDEIAGFASGEKTSPSITEIAGDPDWPAWYPLIDYARCTACGQCADFCLFGVYEKTSNGVRVVNPRSCKTNCPACARICPHTAIVFPKYALGGAISGSDSIDEAAEQQRQSEDLTKILGSDVYQALEQRKRKRQMIIKREAMQKALEDRDRALKR